MKKRLVNIVKKMIVGDGFWSAGSSPRMTYAEFRELESLGFPIQGEKGWGEIAGSGPTLYTLRNREIASEVLLRLLTPRPPDK